MDKRPADVLTRQSLCPAARLAQDGKTTLNAVDILFYDIVSKSYRPATTLHRAPWEAPCHSMRPRGRQGQDQPHQLRLPMDSGPGEDRRQMASRRTLGDPQALGRIR